VAQGFSHYLQQIAAHLPDEAAQLVQGALNLTLLDWYTDGVPAEEATERIRRSAGWTVPPDPPQTGGSFSGSTQMEDGQQSRRPRCMAPLSLMRF